MNKHYAIAHSRDYADSPKAFLLSLTHVAPPHALLVAHWGSDGAAVLSVPTKEYFQSSGWVDQITTVPSPPTSVASIRDEPLDHRGEEIVSVRSGSGFWAGAGHHTESSGDWTASSGIQHHLTGSTSPSAYTPGPSRRQLEKRRQQTHQRQRSDSSTDSDDTEIAGGRGRGPTGAARQDQVNQRPSATPVPNPVVDEVGASDAFIAGMMYALSRRMLPGEPYTPSAVRKDRDGSITGVAGASKSNGQKAADNDRGRWRLEECLR